MVALQLCEDTICLLSIILTSDVVRHIINPSKVYVKIFLIKHIVCSQVFGVRQHFHRLFYYNVGRSEIMNTNVL